MKLTIEIPDTLSVKGAGAESLVNLADYSADALAYIFTYGFNRAHQDRANSIAKKERDETGDADGDAILAKVIAALQEGKINQRGGGTGRTDVEREMISLARPQAKQADEKAYKNADPAARDEMVWDYLEGLTEAKRRVYAEAAEASLKAKEAAAKAKAEALKGFNFDI